MSRQASWALFYLLLLTVVSVVAFAAYHYAADISIPPEPPALQSFGSSSLAMLPSKLEVVVWNIHKGADEGWQADASRFASRASLLLIQEVLFEPAPQENLFTLTNKRWDFATSFLYRSTGAATGVAIGADTTAISAIFSRSTGREPLVRTPKTAVIAYYPLEGRSERLLVANVHAHLLTASYDYEEQLNRIAAQVQTHQGPAIWGGDFNTWSAHRLSLVERMMKAANLQQVTFSPDTRTSFLGRPIDHIFVRGFAVVSSMVHTEVRSSDHKPISCILRLRD